MLSRAQIERYSRQLLLREVGSSGQRRLLESRVLIVGLGGLGSPAALYLAAAGVGTLGLIDHERVELSNLQRQILHSTAQLGRPKTESAREVLTAINPDVKITPYSQPLTSANALDLFRGYDVIVDGSDNFPTRYLVNDACVLLSKPDVYGSALRFEGHVCVFAPGGACYRCLFPTPPPAGRVPRCAAEGILGTVTGLLGVLQANEVLKLLLGFPSSLEGKLLWVDALSLRLEEIRLKKNPQCAICGRRPAITRLIDYEAFCKGVSSGERGA